MTDMTAWKVLLVDDEPDSLALLYEILALHGANVYQAPGGEQALALLKTVLPTLVVVDLAMPKPDGWDLLKVVRETPAIASVPVVAVTAFYSDQVARQAISAGFNGFFQKPIRASAFLSKLKEIAA